MKCEICHIHSATRAVTRRIEGESKELFVCDACARVMPQQKSSPTSITDVLFSLGLPGIEMGDKVDDTVCPACGLSRGDLRASRRMGCPRCYDVFKNDIRAFVVPPPFSAPRDRASFLQQNQRGDGELEKALKKAISEERYEDAAKICERLRVKNGGQGAGKRSHDGNG